MSVESFSIQPVSYHQQIQESLIPLPSSSKLEPGKLTQENVNTLFVHHIQRLSAPYHLKSTLIRTGHTCEAFKISPPGIWYTEDYAKALIQLNDTPIQVNEQYEKASAIYLKMRDKGIFLQSLYGPSDYWELIEDSTSRTGNNQNMIVMKAGKKPSEAIDALEKGLSFFECRTIYTLAILFVLKTIWGEKLFNDTIESFPRFFITTKQNEELLLKKLLIVTNFIIPKNDLPASIPPGMFFYVPGVPTFSKKHRHSSYKGFNVISVKENTFTGFGLDPKGVSLKEIKTFLLNAYNSTPGPLDICASTEHLKREFAEITCSTTDGKIVKMSVDKFAAAMATEMDITDQEKIHIKNVIEKASKDQILGEEIMKKFSTHQLTLSEYEEMARLNEDKEIPLFFLNHELLSIQQAQQIIISNKSCSEYSK